MLAAQFKIGKEKRKLISDRSKSRGRSQTRGLQETIKGVTYADRLKQNKKQ